ncbi:uncharacterized protein LOC106176698 [Lingula anatina]|uniref:Uncharacterized protein LOC106176698 n=1 Tax=Lingula anatina TaxID=7574 RepID=A0A1S3JWG2_LINAN|nr:uncharacterized protein LOC106176698 [Lingula anatina]|eukprot:XP_013414642.1 uncharacterized protein LOC106176698 [Lingula anatina]
MTDTQPPIIANGHPPLLTNGQSIQKGSTAEILDTEPNPKSPKVGKDLNGTQAQVPSPASTSEIKETQGNPSALFPLKSPKESVQVSVPVSSLSDEEQGTLTSTSAASLRVRSISAPGKHPRDLHVQTTHSEQVPTSNQDVRSVEDNTAANDENLSASSVSHSTPHLEEQPKDFSRLITSRLVAGSGQTNAQSSGVVPATSEICAGIVHQYDKDNLETNTAASTSEKPLDAAISSASQEHEDEHEDRSKMSTPEILEMPTENAEVPEKGEVTAVHESQIHRTMSDQNSRGSTPELIEMPAEEISESKMQEEITVSEKSQKHQQVTSAKEEESRTSSPEIIETPSDISNGIIEGSQPDQSTTSIVDDANTSSLLCQYVDLPSSYPDSLPEQGKASPDVSREQDSTASASIVILEGDETFEEYSRATTPDIISPMAPIREIDLEEYDSVEVPKTTPTAVITVNEDEKAQLCGKAFESPRPEDDHVNKQEDEGEGEGDKAKLVVDSPGSPVLSDDILIELEKAKNQMAGEPVVPSMEADSPSPGKNRYKASEKTGLLQSPLSEHTAPGICLCCTLL